jgi:hypothetical protein
MDEGFAEDVPRPVTLDWIAYRYRDLHRRVRNLEARDEKYDPAVTAVQVQSLREDVRALKRAFYTFAFSVVGSAIVFSFTVFALLGKH